METDLNKIEKEIAYSIKESIVSLSHKEQEIIIKEEIKKRGYLPEDWHVNYAVERIKNMIIPPAPESKSLFHYVNPLNWRVGREELKNQVDNYDTLGFFGSARKVAAALMFFSVIITLIFAMVGWFSSEIWVDVVLILILTFFVYKGKGWAMIATMIYWTFSKGFQVVSSFSVEDFSAGKIIMPVIWWGIFMGAFWQAYQVERAHRKISQEKMKKPLSNYCPNCGVKIGEDSKFCTKCGHKIIIS